MNLIEEKEKRRKTFNVMFLTGSRGSAYMGKTIFIAGAYGTGKSTLCINLAYEMDIPFFSAGDLISEINGEVYGKEKVVTDKELNQVLLANKVQSLNKIHEKIILAGHFCIFNKSNEVEILPSFVFHSLNIEQIILLEADEDTIIENLYKRDSKRYSYQSIHQLVTSERKQSVKISKDLGVQLSIYQMTFSDEDINKVIAFIQ